MVVARGSKTIKMTYFILGVILGILVRDIKFETLKFYEKTENKFEEKFGEKAQFIDAETDKEKLKKSADIEEFLKKL